MRWILCLRQRTRWRCYSVHHPWRRQRQYPSTDVRVWFAIVLEYFSSCLSLLECARRMRSHERRQLLLPGNLARSPHAYSEELKGLLPPHRPETSKSANAYKLLILNGGQGPNQTATPAFSGLLTDTAKWFRISAGCSWKKSYGRVVLGLIGMI